MTQKLGHTALVTKNQTIKWQEEAIPLGHHQIHAMEKFEDRPMSPDTWDGLTL